MFMQARAILLDAYRELNHKRLFWFVLGLSGLIVAAFGAVGINDEGLTVLHWEFPAFINTKWVPQEVFYKLAFSNLGIKWWLAWIASILALVSTAGMFPDFVASGSIELTLSRPIARLRLFLYKYCAGLLFVALQVAVFTVASFLVIGFRGKTWEPAIFLAIPLTVAIFSFLFCVCVLLGILTRSTIASLLLTLLFWFLIFGVHATEQGLLFFKEANTAQQERIAKVEQSTKARATKRLEPGKELPPGADPTTGMTELERSRLERNQTRLKELKSNERPLRRFHTLFYVLKTGLPKTTESAELLDRALLSDADRKQLNDFAPGNDRRNSSMSGDDDVPIDEEDVGERMQEKMLARSVWWVIGTSLGFEAVVLGIAAWIFCRRDF